MYGKVILHPQAFARTKPLFISYGGIISLALLCTVPHLFSAGPVLVIKPPCCERGGHSAFAGHFFSTVPTKSAVGDRSGKFLLEERQFSKN